MPFAVLDTTSTGRQTREGSRTLEVRTPSSSLVISVDRCGLQYAFEDFAIRQIAQVLGKTDDEATFAARSLVRDLGAPIFYSR